MKAGFLISLATGLACLTWATWIEAKAYVAQALIAVAWERNQSGARGAKPWPWADTTPVAKLSVVGNDESLVVLEGANGRNLAFGPTHDEASVLPGERGNSVISAHRDTHFRLLETLKRGDTLRIERRDGSAIHFQVSEITIVDSRHTRIALNADTPRLTLVTCYPFNAIRPGGPLRFVVTADFSAGAGHQPPPPVARPAASREQSEVSGIPRLRESSRGRCSTRTPCTPG